MYDGEVAIHTPIDLWTSTGVSKFLRLQHDRKALNLNQIRALDHAVELMYHPLAAEVPTKRLCLDAITNLFTYLPRSRDDPENAEIRTKLFLACYSALFPFLFSGGVGLSHSIGHAIGATYGIPHGITSCLSLAPVILFKASNPEAAKQIARIMFYLAEHSTRSAETDCRIVAEAIAHLVERLGHRTTLTAVCCGIYHALWYILICYSTMCHLAMPKKKLLHHEC